MERDRDEEQFEPEEPYGLDEDDEIEEIPDEEEEDE